MDLVAHVETPFNLFLIPIHCDNLQRLPLHGPLDVKDYDQYLEDGKKTFEKCYPVKSSELVSLDEFKFLKVVGEGGFGKIILVERKNKEGTFYAMKTIRKQFLMERNRAENVLNEKRILQSLDCPFCMRLEHFSQSNSHLYLFMPFISGGDIFTHLSKFGRFEEHLSRFYAAQVVLALEFLHYCDIIHRDLKPENILIDHLGFIKVTDFGFAKKVTGRTYSFCGTVEYTAPEVILGKGHGKAVDWWSLGILIVEMTLGRVPFTSKDENEMETFWQITKAEFAMPELFSSELKKLVEGMLQKDPTKRIGNLWRGIKEIKSHPWFSITNWIALLNRKVDPPFIPDHSKQLSKVNFPNMTAVSSIYTSGPSEAENYDYFKDF